VESLARRHLLRIEERHGERAFELAHDTLIEPIRDRVTRVDAQQLQAVWRKAIEQAAASGPAQSEGLDSEQLIECCYQDFLDESGAPLRVSPHHSGRGNLPAWALEHLTSAGLVKLTPEGYTLSSPELAPALSQIRSTSRDRDLRPLTALVRIVFASVAAIGNTVLVTAVGRSVIAGLHFTLTQAPDVGAFAGWFQGIMGALVWAAFIAPALAGRWYIVDRGVPQSRYPGARWGILGAAAGLAGALPITLALLQAQRPASLAAAGWIIGNSLKSAFTQTGFGWTMLLFGPAVGWGCGFAAMRILNSRDWTILVSRPKPSSMSRTGRAWARIMALAFSRSGYILGSLAAAASALYVVVYALSGRGAVLARIAGETASIALGEIGLVAGLLFGLYLIEKGVDIRAQDNGLPSPSPSAGRRASAG